MDEMTIAEIVDALDSHYVTFAEATKLVRFKLQNAYRRRPEKTGELNEQHSNA